MYRHRHPRPARAVPCLPRAHEVREDGIWGRLAVDPTPAGDQLLAPSPGASGWACPWSTGLLFDPHPDEVIGGVVDVVAHVDEPAFTSARVHTMSAALAATPPPPQERHPP